MKYIFLGNFVKDQHGHLVYPHIIMHKNNKPVQIGLNWSLKFCKKTLTEKQPCCIELCAFRCLGKASSLKPLSDSILCINKCLFLYNFIYISLKGPFLFRVLQDIITEKTALLHRIVCFQMPEKRLHALNLSKIQSLCVNKIPFL